MAVTSAPRFSVARAAVKFVTAGVRSLGVVPTHPGWAGRAEVCERCPMRVSVGKCGTSYCGKPFVYQPSRDPVADGCGCPTHAKAKDPREHCPINRRYAAAQRLGAACDCKWCANSAAATE